MLGGCLTCKYNCFAAEVFFFFKQKTAYEMLRSLVGSEMCIRDRHGFCASVVIGNGYGIIVDNKIHKFATI